MLVAAGAGIGALLRQPANVDTASKVNAHGSGTPTAGAGTHSPSPPPPSLSPDPFQSSFPASGTAIAMAQAQGDGDTDFVVHGFGWPPHDLVTLTVAGDGSAQKKLRVDLAGTFNYVIGHDPVFFPGRIPQGWYRVIATVPGVGTAHTSFHVTPGPPGPPPRG